MRLPRGIKCGADCTETYRDAIQVQLNVQPAADALFVGWDGACTGTGACTVTTDLNKEVTATFKLRDRFTLAVTTAGNGTGAVKSRPRGIKCGADCTETYLEGQQVTLQARASKGSVFAGWRGDGCTGVAPCAVTMNANVAVRAVFTRPGQLFLDAISSMSAIPGARLILQGIAFSPTATLAVRFFNDSGFSVEAPVVAASATELTVVVPPFVDPATRSCSISEPHLATGRIVRRGVLRYVKPPKPDRCWTRSAGRTITTPCSSHLPR